MALCVCDKDHSWHFHRLINWLTRPITRLSNNRWEVAADSTPAQELCNSTPAQELCNSTPAQELWTQKYLATTATSPKKTIVFLKIPTLLEAEAAIAVTCFSMANFESRMTPKIFNSETISTTEPSMTKSASKGSRVREQKIRIPLVLLGFTNITHLLHKSLIIVISFNDAATDAPSRGCGIKLH